VTGDDEAEVTGDDEADVTGDDEAEVCDGEEVVATDDCDDDEAELDRDDTDVEAGDEDGLEERTGDDEAVDDRTGDDDTAEVEAEVDGVVVERVGEGLDDGWEVEGELVAGELEGGGAAQIPRAATWKSSNSPSISSRCWLREINLAAYRSPPLAAA
jgi:hypothetical protein